ncbi:hypothetical protein Teth514_0762 [Thermoanaerobacter sp. X514]|nr:hypothetical protein Teth514_0762 [Thermoanaerobacter sp. X514]
MPRLVYIHEGRETKNGRNKLKNVYYKTYVGEECTGPYLFGLKRLKLLGSHCFVKFLCKTCLAELDLCGFMSI